MLTVREKNLHYAAEYVSARTVQMCVQVPVTDYGEVHAVKTKVRKLCQ